MKRFFALLLACLLLAGCASNSNTNETLGMVETAPPDDTLPVETAYESRFEGEIRINLSDENITWDTPQNLDPDAVSLSHDIIYYEDRDSYDSGNPYGEGTASDRHSAEEAAAHTVVNITAPGAYRVTGKLSAGQIRIDLGEDAYDDPNAVVELILDHADITCTVAPAILFLNVYECDGEWSTETAKAQVDTANAGANLILADGSSNVVNGSYVARIYKDKEGEKKLWKQDGALYSYMSMNVYGPGSLTLTAENEGLDTELHLTIHGGNITILSDNDGINTNEDGVSVTTVNGGTLHIVAGLGAEGDGIDSNGYLVINGGTVISAAKPASDAGLDSDLGSFVNGGTVVAMGSSMDWAESDSEQVTMNLQFSQQQKGAIRILREDGTEVFSFDPALDAVLSANQRTYQGVILSCPDFQVGDSYAVYVGDSQMMYTSTDVMMGHGGKGGKRPEGGQRPDGEMPSMPEGGFGGDREKRGDRGQVDGLSGPTPDAEGSTVFYMQDKVNFFSGLRAVSK